MGGMEGGEGGSIWFTYPSLWMYVEDKIEDNEQGQKNKKIAFEEISDLDEEVQGEESLFREHLAVDGFIFIRRKSGARERPDDWRRGARLRPREKGGAHFKIHDSTISSNSSTGCLFIYYSGSPWKRIH